MVNKKPLKIAFVALIVLGLGMITVGITMPIIIQKQIDEALKNTWMKKSDYKSWGELPGKLGVKVVRGFLMYNITNPEEILLGSKANVTRLPEFPTQEFTKWSDWTYVEKDGTVKKVKIIQDSTDYIAFHSSLNLTNLKNNGTYFPLNAAVTLINAPWYGLMKRYIAGNPVIYALWNLHDMQVALSSDFYVSIIAYTLYQKFLSNQTFALNLLEDVGIVGDLADEIVNDQKFGWGNYLACRVWVKAFLDYEKENVIYDGAFDYIFNYFQVNQLGVLIQKNGGIWNLIQEIVDDMKNRYGDSSGNAIAAMQWANATVSRNLPLGLGSLPTSQQFPYPSFWSINNTLGFIPEIFWSQQLINKTSFDYTPNASTLIEVEYKYPNKNTRTIINLENLTFLLLNLLSGNYSALMSRFQLSSPLLFGPLTTYIQLTVNLPLTLPDGSKLPVDYYSFILSRFAQKALSNSTAQLKFDAFWAVHARNLFGFYMKSGVSCKEIVQSVNVSLEESIEICFNSGWDIFDPFSWTRLIPWAIASTQSSSSLVYQRLKNATGLTENQMNGILYFVNNCIKNSLENVQQHISLYYNCSRPVCTFDEMMIMQWSSSVFTHNLTHYLNETVKPNLTISHWLSSNYDLPIEWLHYNPLLPMPKELASQLITYDMFLTPHYIKLFFNSYFSGNLSKTCQIFHLPSVEYVEGFYKYFQKIVPGSGLFYTAPFHAWVDGIVHPFLNFIYKTSIFEGGNPLSYPFFTIAGNNSDGPTYPKHVMNSGKGDIDKTRQYYKYYGSRYPVKYGRTLCLFCANASKYSTIQVWEHHNNLKSTDGGKFKTYIDKDDKPSAYLDLIKRDISLKYDSTEDYYGLKAFKFKVDSSDFLTSEFEPKNIDYDQYPGGLNGFFNLSMNFGFPFFMSLPNFYKCDKRLKKMINFHDYKGPGKVESFEASEDDEAFIIIHDQTGSSLKLRFKMMASVVVYKDYYFSSISQPIGKEYGLYVPYYTLLRRSQLSHSFVNKHFGPLMQANELKKIFFYMGIIGGVVFLQIGFMIAVFLRRYGRKSHHRYLSLAIRRSIDKRRISQATETEPIDKPPSESGETNN